MNPLHYLSTYIIPNKCGLKPKPYLEVSDLWASHNSVQLIFQMLKAIQLWLFTQTLVTEKKIPLLHHTCHLLFLTFIDFITISLIVVSFPELLRIGQHTV